MARANRLRDRLLGRALFYRWWQGPFVEQKLAPLRAAGALEGRGAVLDVGCGPGTNADLFLGRDYLGLDLNPRYVETARQRFGERFLVADATAWQPSRRYELVLCNSFLHHLDHREADRVLASLSRALAPEGALQVLDLVLPDERNLARLMARMDRGRYARSPAEWRGLVARHFAVTREHRYTLSAGPLRPWAMVWLEGRLR